jgi:tRNA (guanine26-N2/guanine27-N2)-dimethyltransferase
MIEDSYNPDFPSELVREGKVQLLVPKLSAYGVVPQDYAPSRAPVFYNPVMEFNRDLTVLAFRAYQRSMGREISICDPLTSQGVRAIRFAIEVEGVKQVVASDINMNAYLLAKHNVTLNGLDGKVVVKHKDANCVLSCSASPKKRFDVIDVDPFGTPAPFLDASFRALRNGGLLAATATDLAPLCGVHPKACIRKYAGKPLRTEYCHELAIRLLMGSAAASAAKLDIGIQPLFSHSTEHYIRTYLQIGYGAGKADKNTKSLGYILHCFNCLHRETTPRPFGNLTCPECNAKMDWAGPLWIGAIADNSFVEAMIAENKTRAFRNSSRITRLLEQVKVESQLPATYYVIDKFAGKLGLPSPSLQACLNALHSGGFLAVPTHFNSRGVKTNASATELQNIIRQLTQTP